MRPLDKTLILNSFLYTALWTEELDDKQVSDFMPSAIEKAYHIINGFLQRASDIHLARYVTHFDEWDKAEDQLGHDLWLSINGHGAGFFDHVLYGSEDALQEVCRTMRDTRGAGYYINQVWVNELGHIFLE